MKIRFLAPSRSHRWTVCPGSVLAEAMAPSGESSSIANEGTAAHALFEKSLRKNIDAETMLGDQLTLPKGAGTWTVDEDMVQHVQEGVNLVNGKVGKGVRWIESYTPLMLDGVQCGGTLDCGWYGRYREDPLDDDSPLQYQLHVLDLKYGYGSVAEPRNNKQIRIYALGKYKELLKQKKPVEAIHLWIYQPRLDHVDGPFLHDVITVKQLLEFELYLLERIAAIGPKAPRVAGSHCLYCADHGGCVTAEKAMYKMARDSFTEEDISRIGSVMFDLPMMKQWISSVQNLAYVMAQNGEPPTGWVLGAGRRSKVWNGDRTEWTKTMAPKLRKLGLKEDDFAPRKMLGVARVSALLDKDKKKKLADYWHHTPGRERLQPADNARHVPRLENYFDDEDSNENEFLA